MLRYRGSKAVISVPADTELAAMFVPSWANTKDAAITNTPNRVAPVTLGSSRNNFSKVSGDQIGLPNVTVELEDTIIPMKLVRANPHGMVNNWGHSASRGLRAKRAKS